MCTINYGPGKFEAEPCITRLAYCWFGLGDRLDDDDNTETHYGPFTDADINDFLGDMGPICSDCRTTVLAAKRIDCWEDTQGFVYSSVK